MNDQELEFLSVLAYIHLRHGRSGPAVPLLEALRCMQPENTHHAYSLAYAYLLEHEYEKCLRLTEILMKTPLNGIARSLDLIRRRAQLGLGRRNTSGSV